MRAGLDRPGMGAKWRQLDLFGGLLAPTPASVRRHTLMHSADQAPRVFRILKPATWFAPGEVVEEGERARSRRQKSATHPQTGILRKGSATSKVLEYLKGRSDARARHCELRKALGVSKGALDWALNYLRKRGIIAAAPLHIPARKPVLSYWLA